MEKQSEKNRHEFFHLRNDYVFKSVFKTEKTHALKFLINSVTACPVKSVILTPGESLAQKKNDKRIYQDIRCKDENGNFYNIEMQNSSLTAVEEDRFLFTGCKSIAGQLKAGEDYRLIKRSETIIFTNSHYDKQLHVLYEMYDQDIKRRMIHRKIIIHIISIPVIKTILKRKLATGEALEDLEFICSLIQEGFDPMIYKKASEAQKKIYKVMEDSYQTLYNDPTEVTNAEQAFFYQHSLEAHRELGMIEGKKEGLIEGKRELLAELLTMKFGMLSKDTQQVLMTASPEVIEQMTKKYHQIEDKNDLLLFLEHLTKDDN